jgi:S-ribosylhomocysteine lyase
VEKIASFTIDHLRLPSGLFVSRRDQFQSVVITTFDLRFKTPNKEPVMDMPALHTIEHLGATFLRSHKDWSKKVVYFGPMGCRTGFYLILAGDFTSSEVLPLVREMLDFMEQFDGPIPGASAKECGNWQEQNLEMAKWEAARYNNVLKNAKHENLNYPD